MNLRAALREIEAVVRTAKPEPMFVMRTTRRG
jgi:hypothetical protein